MQTPADEEQLQKLRREMRAITVEIIDRVQQRLEIATKIGEMKRKLDLDVRDEKVAKEITDHVASVARQKGLRTDFAVQILNVLLQQSELVQGTNRSTPPKSTHLTIFSRAKQMELAGKRIIHMEVGEPDYPAPAKAGTAMFDAFQKREYRYTDTAGIPKLRAAIASRERVKESEVIVTPGGRFAIFAAITGLLSPGEEIVVIEPAWPAYKESAAFASARVNTIRTTLDDAWIPDLGALESSISASTKMIAINYPNNPTGAVLPPDVMEEIVRISSKHGIYLLSDEVYSHYSDTAFKSVIEYGYDRSIMVQSFSKTYAMTGFRIGYAVARSQIIDKIRRVQSVAITSVPEPVQHAALAALGEDPKENALVMRRRLDYLCSRMAKLPMRFKKPGGAMYVFPELSGIRDIDFVDSMLERGVAIAQGSGFGESYSHFLRISACQPEALLAEGMDAIEHSLSGDRK